MDILLLVLLLTAHFIGDFYLQPSHWVECRNTNHIKSKGLWQHILIHILLYTLVFLVVDYPLCSTFAAITTIAITHLLTDYWKSYKKKNLRYFLMDQIIHIVIIFGVWLLLNDVSSKQVTAFFNNIVSPKTMVIAIAYLLICKPASVIISLALKKHTDSLTHNHKEMGLASAGAWIGYIERCLAISFIFMGQFSGIGFLVATKTIFRFGDLTKNKDMKLTEYMMLGTLLSYAIALFIGWGGLQVYKLV